MEAVANQADTKSTHEIQSAAWLIVAAAALRTAFGILMASCRTQLRKERGRTGQSRSAVLSDVKDKALAVSRRLQTHNALEEFEVYRWAEGLLEHAECIELKTRMNKELANVPKRLF
jgi:hypothetical protein